MDLIVPKTVLLPLLARAVGVANKKSALPILGNVLLATAGNSLRVSATDLYLAITGEAACDVAFQGSVAPPAKDLFERVKLMPAGPIQIVASSGGSCVTTLKAVGSPRRFTLHGIPGSEFPPPPVPKPDAPTLELPVATWARLLASTHFSISTDETRSHVNSLLVEWTGNKVLAVSTDGHRLTKMDVAIEGFGAHNGTMLLPLKAVNELRRLLGEVADPKDAAAKLTLTLSGPSAFFHVGGMDFSVKLVDAQFPPWQQVLPAVAPQQARVPRDALLDAIKAVKLASGTGTTAGGVKLSLAPGMLRITSESPESGSAFDEVAVDYSGPQMTAAFSASYVLDALNAMEGEEALLGVTGALDPALLRPASEVDGSSFVACLMPRRF